MIAGAVNPIVKLFWNLRPPIAVLPRFALGVSVVTYRVYDGLGPIDMRTYLESHRMGRTEGFP